MTQIYPDAHIVNILNRTKVIALVGLSARPDRASHQVAKYLNDKGYRVIGVNPGLAGQEMFGEVVVPDLASLPEGVDMVDIFRRSDQVAPVVDAALAHISGLKTVWMQLGISNADAQAKAQAAGVEVIQDRCPKIEYARLMPVERQGLA